MRTIVELFKILKTQSPVSIYNKFTFCNNTYNYTLLYPKFKLDISKNNFIVKSVSLWNTCIKNLLDKPVLFLPEWSNGLELIIPGNVKNSDLTISVTLFKKRLADFLMKIQSQGNANEWSDVNYF